METTIKLLNGEELLEKDILRLMLEDEYYYGHLGKYALSSSSFKTILSSWDEYQLELNGMGRDIPKQALRDGRLIHLAVLEEHRLKDLTIIDSTKGSKAFKNAVEEFNETMVYTTREMDKCIPLAENVIKDFDAWALLDGADKELPGIKMIDGIPVRAKADIINHEYKHLIDLKTTADASRFEQSIDMFGYDLQGALYLHIFDCERFSFIILDKTTGEVTTRELKPAELARGRKKLRKAINIFKENYNEVY